MFYSQFILAKKGPLGTIWIAAHLERKLKKNQVADTDIGDSVDSILFPDVPIALRLSSHLLLGVVRIYSKKVNYLFHDCSETLLKVKQAFRSTAVDLPPEESTAPYHSITLPETFDLDDFELPDTVGNFDDRNVSTKEQITLQDALDGAGFSNLQFGLDERFGDEDVSQIGLDFEEDFLRDSNLMFQQVKEGVFQHGEGPSESMKINDSEEQASHDKENNDADSELSKLLGVDRGKNVITNFQNVNKSDELSHRLMFNIRTPDLNEVFMPDNGCIGGPSGTHDIDMDPTSPEFNEPNNLPITPMAKEVAMVQETECVDVANGNILNESPITPMVQEVKCAKEANEDIPKATLTIPESNIVVVNEPNCTLDELPTTHMVQEVQSADAANDNIQNAISTNLESNNYVLNDPANILDDSKNAENASIPMPTNVTDPKLADEHVVLQFSDSTVATPGLVDKEPDLVAASALPSGVVCSEESSHVVSSRNGIPTLNHPQIGDVNSVQTNHISFLNTDIHMKSCTSVSNQANLVPPGEPYYSVTPAVDKSIQSREPTVSIQGPPSAIAINTNTEAQPKLNDVQPDQLKHLPSSEAPEPEKLFFTPAVNVTSSNDQNMHLSQGLPSDIAIDTNMEAQPKLNDGQLDQLNCLPSSEAPEPERLLFTPAVNITPSIDQNMHFSQGPPDVAVNTNMEAQPKLNDVQLDQLNHLPSSEAPEPERLLFTPAVNFTLSNDQNMHFSQGPPSNIAINTILEAQPKLDDVRLDQLNHLPNSEASEPERVLFAPAINFTPSNDQLNHLPSSEAPEPERVLFTPAVNFTPSNDQLNHLPSSEAPAPERVLFTPAVNFTPSNDQLNHIPSSEAPEPERVLFTPAVNFTPSNDQLNHLPSSEAPEPERVLFTPAVNFTPSNDQNMHFSQGMHFAQGMQFNQGMHSSQGMQFSQDMHSSRGIQFSQDMHFRGPSTNMHDFSSDNATVTNREKFVQEKSNEHINQLNYVSNSQFSEPERMLFTPSVNHFAPNNIEKQPANKNVIDFDESVDRTGTLSGKKRPLTDSTPYILNDASFNMSSVLQKRQHNDYIIPQDDDLLASILVGRTPALKVGPSPPIPKPPTSKRPRLTQKSGLPKRRKVLLDDPIVLHADTIRQQLINTDDIRRLRKKVPCTIPEILRLQRNLLEEGEEEKDIFGGSMFTGISQKLISLNTRKYVFAQKLSQHRINHDPTIEVIKEFGGNKSPVSVMDNNGPETVAPCIAQLEKVNASEIVTPNVEVVERINASEVVTSNVEVLERIHESEIVTPNVEVAERINTSEVVTSNVEALERIHVSEIVTPNVEVSEKINMSEIVTHVEVSDGVNVTEIVTPNVEVSERVNVSDVVTPVVEVSERVDRPELIDTENCNNHFSIATQEPHTVDIPEIETSNAEFGDTVIEKKCDELSNDLLLGAPDMPVTVNDNMPHQSDLSNDKATEIIVEDMAVDDNMPHQSDLSNDKATEITVEDMAVDVVNMAEVGSEFKEYASYIVGEANSLDPDLCIIERGHAASAMDENLSVNAEAGLDVGNDHIEHEPTKDSNENLSVNIETGLHVENNHIEQAGTKESDENSSLNVQTGLDVESNHIELAATKESDEFDDDIDNIDTDFLNVDDDVEYDEDTTTDVQNAEDTQTLETAGWSSRTRGVANYLKIMFDQESGRGRKSVAIDQLLAGKTRKEASRMFFETLVLKTRDYIQVEQETPFAYINVQPRTKLLKSEF